jgi:nitroreductase
MQSESLTPESVDGAGGAAISLDVLTAIQSRASAAKLTAPGPSDDELRAILSAGVRAPDHGRLRPWRFIVIEGKARDQFADLLGHALKARDPSASDASIEMERAKAMRAPTVIVVAAATQPEHPKIPAIEQILAVGAAVENMILAAQALGYGAMWKTGGLAYDPFVKEGLGLDPTHHIASLLYLGTTQVAPKPRPPVLDGLVRYL